MFEVHAVPPVAVEVSGGDEFWYPVVLIVLGFCLATALILLGPSWLLYRSCIEMNEANRIRYFNVLDRMEAGENMINAEPVEDPVDHPIWYTRTEGLEQSVVNSIRVVKYKKDEGLVEGGACAICLSEFEEGGSLRLLPKCAHAFHVPCVDQWFRSHKNCPLCRSLIPDVNSWLVFSMEDLQEEVWRRPLEPENQENGASLDGQQPVETVRVTSDVLDTSEEDSDSDSDLGYFVPANGSNVSECSKVKIATNPAESQKVTDKEVQPTRRSVSADPATALRINEAAADINLNASPGAEA